MTNDPSKLLFFDVEVYSGADLPAVGAWKYAEDPTTRIVMATWAFGVDGPVQVWDSRESPRPPKELTRALLDRSVTKVAHNAQFDYAVVRRAWGLPTEIEGWRCTMVWALYLSLPASLDELGEELGVPRPKLKDGKALVLRFCTAKGVEDGAKKRQRGLWDDEAEARDWARFREYAARDVEALQDIHRRLEPRPMPGRLWRLWHLDQRINERGLPVDLGMVAKAQSLVEEHHGRLTTELVDTTGTGTGRDQLLKWTREQGVVLPDLKAETVTGLLKGDLPDVVRQVLQARQQLASTSVAKYATFLAATCRDGRLRGSFQFYGANRTGRWAGRLVQPHNLPRGTVKDLDTAREALLEGDLDWLQALFGDLSGVLSSLVRTAIAAPEGQKLVVADYSSIESVMLAWAAECDYLLDLFRAGRDPYIDFASEHLFKVPYDKVQKWQRTLAKPAVLGCGYGLGPVGLQQYAASFGVVLSAEDAAAQVNAYRQAYPEIPQFWNRVGSAAIAAVQTQRTTKAAAFTFRPEGDYLFLDLPAGRSLAYYQPSVDRTGRGYPKLGYRSRGKLRVTAHASGLVENIVQAISCDVLCNGLEYTNEDDGLDIVGHVHDEIITLAAEDDAGALERLLAAMTVRPSWCEDAPIKAAGWEGPWYRKD